MFTYNNLQIISAVSKYRILEYFDEIGAVQTSCDIYELHDIEVRLTPCEIATFAVFDIPRHKISVTGERAAAEKFLTNFRLRFLSVGG